MPPIPVLENCVHEKLFQFSASGELQKRKLREAEELVLRNIRVQECLKSIQKVTNEQIPKLIGNIGAIAAKVSNFSEDTQNRSERLRKLQVLLERVNAARVVAESQLQMERSTIEVEAAKKENDLPRMVALLLASESAKERLLSQFPMQLNMIESTMRTSRSRADFSSEGRNEVESLFKSSSSVAVESIRDQCVKMVMDQVQQAQQNGDRELLLSCMSFLVQLGRREMAVEAFGNFLSQHIVHLLRTEVVDVELAKMNTPHAALSHLVLLSRMLDSVAGTLEAEDGVIRHLLCGRKGSNCTSSIQDGSPPQGEGKERNGIVVDEKLLRITRSTLLEMLHNEATLGSARIVEDLFQRRKGVIEDLQKAVKRHRKEKGKHNYPSSFASPNSASPSSGITSGTTSLSTSATVAPTAATLASVSRGADQLLEDISHIASCCHLYFEFYLKNVRSTSPQDDSPKKRLLEKGKDLDNTSSVSHSGIGTGERPLTTHTGKIIAECGKMEVFRLDEGVDYLWLSMDNPLLISAQQLLSVYCPVQLDYFEFAFSQALAIQRESIDELVKALYQSSNGGTAKQRGTGKGMNSSTGMGPENSEGSPLFYHLRELYEQSSSLFLSPPFPNCPNTDMAMLTEHVYFAHNDLITLPDDVFFVLRIALHRAFNTKSTQIIYAVLPYIVDVVQSSLITEMERQVRLWPSGVRRREDGDEGYGYTVLSPRVLRWISATHISGEYTTKLSEELLRVGSQTYSGAVLQRLKEQAADFDATAKLLKEKVQMWLRSCARELWNLSAVGPATVRKLKAQDYVLSEEQLFLLEVHDPWAQALLMSSEEVLTEIHKVLGHDIFDEFLIHFTQVMTENLREVLGTKKFNGVGALQLDKEIRAIRFFFSNLAQKSTLLRDVFSPLSLIATLLLSETPQDALDELHNTSLTGKEKKQVLLQRVEFSEAEVLSLKIG